MTTLKILFALQMQLLLVFYINLNCLFPVKKKMHFLRKVSLVTNGYFLNSSSRYFFYHSEYRPNTISCQKRHCSLYSLPAAIIHSREGNANAILSGVHPEFPVPGAQPEPED